MECFPSPLIPIAWIVVGVSFRRTRWWKETHLLCDCQFPATQSRCRAYVSFGAQLNVRAYQYAPSVIFAYRVGPVAGRLLYFPFDHVPRVLRSTLQHKIMGCVVDSYRVISQKRTAEQSISFQSVRNYGSRDTKIKLYRTKFKILVKVILKVLTAITIVIKIRIVNSLPNRRVVTLVFIVILNIRAILQQHIVFGCSGLR